MKNLDSKTLKLYVGYAFLILIILICSVLFFRSTNIGEFLTSIENRTFDLRQTILMGSRSKKVNKDIVLVTIDDASFEYLLGKYGEWPIPRDVYAKLVNYMEKQKPKAIAFDLMFIKSLKSKNNADAALVNSIVENKNVFTAMNFDNQTYDVRKPTKLPDNIKANVVNDSKINFINYLKFTNCRPILSQIIKGTPNIGLINASRSNDGILRKLPPVMLYQGDFYPHLALLAGLKYLSDNGSLKKDFYIDKNSNLITSVRTIPLDKDGGAILNWYGPAGKTFKEIPLYKIVKAMNENKSGSEFDLKDKIIYIGTTAVSLFDAKTVPVAKLYPGVEIHATYVNNLINNEFIKKVSPLTNAVICIILTLFVGFIVFKATTTFISLGSTLLISFAYVVFSFYMMKFYNLWIDIAMPLLSIVVIFAAVYIIKYILKSRDFEYQYKLATTDGLTELYNHRYFQEQMLLQLENSKRYNTEFSLILIDIDFFKRFNDTFGHQSGDAVLRQVSAKLKKNIRATDFACRYGGEEMAIILPNTGREKVIATSQKICQIIAEEPFNLANNQKSNVTVSIGISTFPEDGKTTDELISKADERLYFAKENGRNQVGI